MKCRKKLSGDQLLCFSYLFAPDVAAVGKVAQSGGHHGGLVAAARGQERVHHLTAECYQRRMLAVRVAGVTHRVAKKGVAVHNRLVQVHIHGDIATEICTLGESEADCS